MLTKHAKANLLFKNIKNVVMKEKGLFSLLLREENTWKEWIIRVSCVGR